MEEKPATIFPMFSISVLGINVHLTGDLSIMMMMMMTGGNLLASHDDDDDDDVNDDCDDNDIYIMVKCLSVTFLLISFSPFSRHFWV